MNTRLAAYTSTARGWVKGNPIRFIHGHRQNLLRGTQYEKVPIKERFWKYVQKTDTCWIWIGARHDFGYGEIWHKRRYIGSHRVSWELHNGDIPKGLSVLHKCDNPSCVRPSHLFLGTQKDNIRDGMKKGRIRLINLSKGATFAPLASEIEA